MRRRSVTASTLCTSSPSTRTAPALGSISRLTSRSRVVLPEPEGPTMARNSRARTSSETPSSTGAAPPKLFETLANEMTAGAELMPAPSIAGSLHRHAAGLDRAAPARNFARDEFPEILRRAAFEGRDFLADRLEPPTHGRQIERVAERGVELSDDRRRRALGEEQALPGQHVEIEPL